jgi:hypothetical protein
MGFELVAWLREFLINKLAAMIDLLQFAVFRLENHGNFVTHYFRDYSRMGCVHTEPSRFPGAERPLNITEGLYQFSDTFELLFVGRNRPSAFA